jgi:hypothetical protein
MSNIDNGRVILGGLLAGLVINIGEFLRDGVLMAERVAGMLTKLGLSEPSGGQLLLFTIVGFALGIVAVWLYAAVRPRFGPGVRTAILTGVVIWLLVYVLPSIGYAALDMFAGDYLVIANVWGLVEIPLATVAGAWLYQE